MVTQKKNKKKIRDLIAYVVTAAWATSFVVDLFVRDYEPPAGVQALMMLVAGAMFADTFKRPAKSEEVVEEA